MYFQMQKDINKEVEWYEDSINITMQANMHSHDAIFPSVKKLGPKSKH